MGFVVGCGVFYFRQENMIFYPEALPPDFQYSFPARFDEVTISVDGAVINALHFKTDTPKGAIVYFHGNAGNLSGWGEVALDFTRLGYDVLIPDYRGYGKSTGKIYSEKMLHRDAAVAYDYLKGRYQEDQIVIYGRSIGTGIAVVSRKRDQAAYGYPGVAHVQYAGPRQVSLSFHTESTRLVDAKISHANGLVDCRYPLPCLFVPRHRG